MKHAFPNAVSRDVDHALATLLLAPGQSELSRFRIAKRMWDQFYANARHYVPNAAGAISVANKAMQLKTRRDFLDCDIYHLACFGWHDADVTILTCDPPDSILNRIAVYKGMVNAAASRALDVPEDRFPLLRAGIIARCEPNGEITHIFPIQEIATIG